MNTTGTIQRLEDLFSRREAILEYEEVWTRDIGQYIREESHEACIEGGGTLFTLQPPFTGHTLRAGLSDEEKIDGDGLLIDPQSIVLAELHFTNGNLNGPCKLYTSPGECFLRVSLKMDFVLLVKKEISLGFIRMESTIID